MVSRRDQIKTMRKTMNISLQDDLYEYILERARTSCFSSASEYIRWLVRCDRNGQIPTEVKEKAKSQARTMNETMFIGMFEEFLDDYYRRNGPA